MEEWKEYRLGDVISIAGGFAYKGDLIGEGDNFLLSMGCVSFSENFLDKGARQYAGECPERFYAVPGDIVLATRQQSDNLPILGMPAIIPSKYEGHKMIVGANLYRVDIKDKSFSNRYLYWLLKTPSYVNHIRSCQSGTTVRMITKSNIEDYIFYAPDKATRDKMSDFIWALDDKIELNRKINANLEAQAQALFKSWFVDFEPFKDQPFVESELGMIPEGWRVGNIYEYIDVIYGAPYKSSLFNEDKDGLPLIRIRDLKTNAPQFYTPELLPNTEYINAGDIVAGMDAEFIPYVWLGERGVLNQRCCKFKGKNDAINNYYILFLIKPELEYVQSYKTGTTVSHLGKSDIDRFKLMTPPLDVVLAFSERVNPMKEEVVNRAKESRRLASLRDTLLPRLMSGELKVNEVI